VNRRQIIALLPAVAAVAATMSAPSPTRAQAPAKVVTYTFVSSPDFLNTDVGNVTLTAGYQAGSPNSINRSYRDALDFVMDAFAAEHPQDVLVAGDLVQGHWGKDTLATGTFGRVNTESSRRTAVMNAARVYYRQWMARFAARGLDVHAAIGDHELGDNPWRSWRNWYPGFKHRNLGLFKGQFHRYVIAPKDYRSHPAGPAAGTAYATYLDPEVLLVSVDVFDKTLKNVTIGIDPQQRDWLDSTLARARARGVDWIIVQGHTPVLGPVRVHASSGLMVAGGARSSLWRTMARYGVDLYLCGEVHATTAIHGAATGITQISHGGLFSFGLTTYLTGRVYADGARMDLTVIDFDFTSSLATDPRRLWQTDLHHARPPIAIAYSNPHVVGTMTLTRHNRVLSRDGMLAVYRP